MRSDYRRNFAQPVPLTVADADSACPHTEPQPERAANFAQQQFGRGPAVERRSREDRPTCLLQDGSDCENH